MMAVGDDIFSERLADPRLIHRALYEGVLPPDIHFLAGAYRGSDHAYLKDLRIGFAFTETEGTTDLAPPQEVSGLMASYRSDVSALISTTHESSMALVRDAAKVIATFGYVHPFWDGNGHIQRLTFDCLLRRRGIKLAETWAIHPCPYGEDGHRALVSRDLRRIVDLLMRFVD